jgi:hypothetical protein
MIRGAESDVSAHARTVTPFKQVDLQHSIDMAAVFILGLSFPNTLNLCLGSGDRQSGTSI